ncbi:MAG: hypothetical protein E7580_07700 [Ruminococcaceae bacterium]|nr:hypothetical protein [Oscillospiraceae bacterium]
MRLRIKRIKFDVFILLLSLFCFVGSVGNAFFINESTKLTEEKTVEVIATFDSITVSGEENNLSAEIYTKEYENSFLISLSICNRINLDDLRGLKKGDTLFIGIVKEYEKQINQDQVVFMDIVSLRTDSQIIFDLEDHNAYVKEDARPAIIAALVVALISLSVFFFFLFRIMRKNKKKKANLLSK